MIPTAAITQPDQQIPADPFPPSGIVRAHVLGLRQKLALTRRLLRLTEQREHAEKMVAFQARRQVGDAVSA